MATPEQPQRDELIAAVKSMAPFPILMATFMLVYAVWFGVAWGVIGWAVFALFGVYAAWLIFCGVQHIRVTKKLPKPTPTPASKRIAKQMQLLSTVSYAPLWIIFALLGMFQQQIYIMPVLVLVVGLHFIPHGIDWLLPCLCNEYFVASGLCCQQHWWGTRNRRIWPIHGVGSQATYEPNKPRIRIIQNCTHNRVTCKIQVKISV